MAPIVGSTRVLEKLALTFGEGPAKRAGEGFGTGMR